MNNLDENKVSQTKTTLTAFVDDVANDRYWHTAKEITINAEKTISIDNNTARFYRITELTAEKEATLRQDVENVIACLDNDDFRWVYYISATPSGVELYFGVVKTNDKARVHDYAELLKSQLMGNLAGIKTDRVHSEFLEPAILKPLKDSKHFGLVQGVPSQTLDRQSGENSATQGIDRLTRALIGEEWQLLIINEPVSDESISQQINSIMQLSSDLNPYVKHSTQSGENTSETSSETEGSSVTHGLTETTGSSHSKAKTTGGSKTTTKTKGSNTGGSSGSSTNSSSSGTSSSKSWGDNTSTAIATGKNESTSTTDATNTGKSISENKATTHSETTSKTKGTSNSNTVEYLNKKVERIQEHINDVLIDRFSLGHSKGMFRTAVYISAKYKAIYERLASGMTSIFQGNQSHFTPLKVAKIDLQGASPEALFQLQTQSISEQEKNFALIHSMPVSQQHNEQRLYAGSLLNASELSLMVGLPSREVAGVALRKNVDFAVNPINPETGFNLGSIIQNGRVIDSVTVRLDKKLLNQHIFICGVTGAGKTTTCQQILTAAKLPFLVIEPAKTEYRSLSKVLPDMQFYTLGNEKISPFRFNPFELLPNEKLSGHIDMLKATFAAVFPMEASMPYLIEEAIVESYKKKGWDIHEDENYIYDDPWNCNGQCFPIMSEMLEMLKKVVESKGFGKDLQEKYEGSLISRLDNLTVGVKGRMLNTRNSIDINQLLDSQVVIELEDLRDEQDKALMMGLLLNSMAEAVKHRHAQDNSFQHITLLEEAHRLLSKPTMGDDGAKKLGVEQFANLLAEVRKYGECLIIADQIPNKLTPEVIKNTNTKIIHRLFAADDRHAIGDTVGLSDEQKDFLPLLKAGEVIAYSAGWHAAVRMQVNQINDTNAPVVDEQKLIKMGTQRFFEQRHKLYPNVSACYDWQDAKTYRRFITLGTKYINLWIKWFANEIPARLIEHLNSVITTEYLYLDVANALAMLYQDTSCLQNEEITKHALEVMQTAITASEDLSVQTLMDLPENRPQKSKFEGLFKNIKTI